MEHVQQFVDTLVTEVIQPTLNNNLSLENDNNTTSSEPIYDCEQKISLRWLWRPPTRLPPPVGPVDIGFMLKSIDFTLFQQNPEIAEHCLLISTTVNRVRSMLQDSTEMLYTYLNLLRVLMTLFDNTNVKSRTYFPSHSSASSNLAAEYIQVLLLLAQRLYTQTLDVPDGGEKAALLNECVAAMEEVCETGDMIQGDRYEQDRRLRRWQYIKPPKSLSPESLVSDPATRLEEFRLEDSRLLRHFLRNELGGLSQLSAHLMLIQLQKNEMRARQLELEVRRDLSAQNVIVYSVLAPVIQSVLNDYTAILTQLQQKWSHSRLAQYAELMHLYWTTRQQYLLAASDFAVYETVAQDNFIDYGNRALRRLRAMTLLSETDKEIVQTLYNRVVDEMEGQYGANGLEIDEIEAFTLPDQNKRNFTHYASQQWLRFRVQNNGVQISLDVLTSLYGDETSRSTVLVVTNASTINNGNIQPVGSSMTNAAKAATLYERLRGLQWLLSLVDLKEEIVLDQSQVVTLRNELVSVEQVMLANKMVY